MKVALTGATGFVGQAALEVLAHRGHSVRALARTVPDKKPSGVEWVGGDLSDRRALDRLVDGVDAVIHLAGLTTAVDPQDFEEPNVTGTLSMVEASLDAGVRRFVFVSSLAAREPGLSAYGASKLRAEKIVQASGLDWTIVRPPAVFGPRDKDMLELFKGAVLRVVPVPPEGRVSLIYVYDLAELLVAALPSSEATTSATFEPDDGRQFGWEHRELAKGIGWAVGSHPWVPELSKRTLGFLSKAESLFRGKKTKLTQDRIGYICHPDWVCDPAHAVPSSLWQPKVATRDALKMTAKWYRKHKWL